MAKSAPSAITKNFGPTEHIFHGKQRWRVSQNFRYFSPKLMDYPCGGIKKVFGIGSFKKFEILKLG